MKRMADPVRKTDRHYTYADYVTWPDDERWGLIDGVAFNMSASPLRNHQKILGNLHVMVYLLDDAGRYPPDPALYHLGDSVRGTVVAGLAVDLGELFGPEP